MRHAVTRILHLREHHMLATGGIGGRPVRSPSKFSPMVRRAWSRKNAAGGHRMERVNQEVDETPASILPRSIFTDGQMSVQLSTTLTLEATLAPDQIKRAPDGTHQSSRFISTSVCADRASNPRIMYSPRVPRLHAYREDRRDVFHFRRGMLGNR